MYLQQICISTYYWRIARNAVSRIGFIFFEESQIVSSSDFDQMCTACICKMHAPISLLFDVLCLGIFLSILMPCKIFYFYQDYAILFKNICFTGLSYLNFNVEICIKQRYPD